MNVIGDAGPGIEERLRQLCRFVRAHEHIADSHTVDFFTSNVWSRLPAHWQRQLLALPDSTLCQLPLASYAVLSSTSGQLFSLSRASYRLLADRPSSWVPWYTYCVWAMSHAMQMLSSSHLPHWLDHDVPFPLICCYTWLYSATWGKCHSVLCTQCNAIYLNNYLAIWIHIYSQFTTCS